MVLVALVSGKPILHDFKITKATFKRWHYALLKMNQIKTVEPRVAKNLLMAVPLH
jgi:hypothetical protein